ncbi:Transcriptional regulatory protein BasR [Pseudomonas syringae pv. actinidiae]|uniref:response regulator n=1 Tax=Pseudomonas syringae TaxID=317 RepID=UPI000A25667B|nr:response regulator [Pseudomonas syringae]OSN24793.1 Transcriptional regulatory protein BasR [Pseudomonas syringae pv. actinidiae]
MPMLNQSQQEVKISGKVVVVEDDELMRGLIVEIFTDLGASCISFITADDAMVHLLQCKAHCTLLITDYTLPGQLDGKELALLVHQKWPVVPVIVTTGYGMEVSEGLPEGIAFLRKPWSIETLVEKVRTMIAVRKIRC